MTEQAYHARGAAAIREAVEIIEEVYQDLGALRGISPATHNRIIKWREREPGADTRAGAREEALFQAANTAAINLATSMNLREHPDSCECYGCGLNRAVVNFALARAKENVRPIVERELQAERWGADTGTTVAEELSGMLAERMIKLAIKIQGPYATFGPPESLERRKKSHQERIEELTGMLTTEFAECLERGTTPPDEGLALERAANWFEERGGKWDAEFIATQLRALATTQRAPVEQGRLCEQVQALRPVTDMYDGDGDQRIRRKGYERAKEDVLKLLAAPPVEQGPLKLNYVPRWNSQIVAAEVVSEIRGLDVVTCQNEVALHDAIAKVVKRATEAAAPDHAREGALLREAKWWYKEFVWPWRADDEDSDDRARKRLAALADGKEGGE